MLNFKPNFSNRVILNVLEVSICTRVKRKIRLRGQVQSDQEKVRGRIFRGVARVREGSVPSIF